ncbi:hypothetical protein [Halorubrum yunnanense]|uniref:Core-binding (CB) domain-containing protein n=1 Tax=Halorubrum yunnanense TaxID=1526162 RepID=A0ABD5YLC4_9EURY|nr:hypothetical protein [Halorubrum yunnanense]
MTDEIDENHVESDEKSLKRDLERTQTETRTDRRNTAKEQWRTSPIDAYESGKLDKLGDSNRKRYLRQVRDFEEYLLTQIAPENKYDILGVRDAVESDVEEWKNESLIPRQKLGLGTIEGYLQGLRSFYTTLNEEDAFAGNPVRTPLSDFRDEYEDELGDAGRPYIPLTRLKTFMNWLDTPFARAMWLLAFKLGNRKGETINLDLRCLNIAHPVFDQIIAKHDINLDPRVRDRPDTLLIYGNFTKGSEMPNDNTPGWEGDGEIREAGNKRKRDTGSVMPVDSELKTALIEWLLVRPPTFHRDLHPLFAIGASSVRRPVTNTVECRLWLETYVDSIRRFAREESLEECPTCNTPVTAQNLETGEKTGRRYRCRNCSAVHWRSIFWGPQQTAENYDEFDTTYSTEQKVVYHQGRHTFSSAHSVKNSDLHDGVIPKAVRTEAIRGDSNNQGDTEDQVYIEDQYQNFEKDVREPYLHGAEGADGIYKFGLYDDLIPAVGEGWENE